MLLAMIILLAMVQRAQAAALVVETVGEAHDLDTGLPLYSETHCVSEDAAVREVSFRDGDDALIAFKTLHYGTGPTTPAFVQQNINTQDSVAIAIEQGEIVMTFAAAAAASGAVESGQAGSDRVVARQPDADLPLVVDAGFDGFVKTHWESLLAGESQRFQFPLAARETLLELQISSANCGYESQTDQCFTLEPGNWLLKMLAEPIELGYDRQLRRLTRFRGVSNISAADGGRLEVDIRYRYSDLAAVDCARDGLSAILDAGLSAAQEN